jgi:hypothetical protein
MQIMTRVPVAGGIAVVVTVQPLLLALVQICGRERVFNGLYEKIEPAHLSLPSSKISALRYVASLTFTAMVGS